MDRWKRCVRASLLVLSIASPLKADVIFQDGFETGDLSSAWTVSGVDTGRVRVTSDFSPYASSKHLVLDDSVDDAAYGVAEATLSVDLTNWKNVYISVRAKSLGNVTQGPPDTNFTTFRTYDGACMSLDGGTTWHRVALIGSTTTSGMTYRLSIDPIQVLLGAGYGRNTLIRFSFYGKGSAPNDGLALDNVTLEGTYEPRIQVEMPLNVAEGSGSHTGTVRLPSVSATDVTVDLVASTAGLNLPASVTVPAGQLSSSFQFTVTDDEILNPNRRVLVTPSSVPGYGTAGTIVTIQDNETPPLVTLTIPSSVTEGVSISSANARVTLSAPVAVPVTFDLFSNPPGEVTMPYSVTIPAGQTEVAFLVRAVNDTIADGLQTITVFAVAGGFATAQGQIVAEDNDTPKLTLSVPASLTEGLAGTATVSIPYTKSTDVTISLSNGSPSALTVPVSVVIPAGQLSVSFTVASINDSLVNMSRSVTLSASASGFTSGTANQIIMDDEVAPVVGLSIPSSLVEGQPQSLNAGITLDVAPDVNILFTFTASPSGQLSVPSTVTLPAGQRQVSFTVSANDDGKIDGSIPVVVKVAQNGIEKASASTVAIDIAQREIGYVASTTLYEGSNIKGKVSIPGTLTSDVLVSLSCTESSVTLPSSVTIKAGTTYVEFSISALDNGVLEGIRDFTMAISADSFPSRDYLFQLKDSLAGYQFSNYKDIARLEGSYLVSLNAQDEDGALISDFSGTVDLSLIQPDGSVLPVSPAQVTITGSGWTGNLYLPANALPGCSLRATDASGRQGKTEKLEVMRVLPQWTADMVWDQVRKRIYATVPAAASGSYKNRLIAIDPETLQITGSVLLGGDPRSMAFTAGGEYLYVSLAADGTIAKIDPATMSVLSVFTVGTSSLFPNVSLYAADMVVHSEDPDILIVSQSYKNTLLSHEAVAVYDHGVMRPVRAMYSGTNAIESSADASIIYGYNNISTQDNFSRLQVSNQGVVEISKRNDFAESYGNFRTVGDKAYTDSGKIIDGAAMRLLGQFSTSGLVCPDPAINRVFYLGINQTGNYERIVSCDPSNLSTLRNLTMPWVIGVQRFIRVGAGFAFNSSTGIAFVSGKSLVPSDPATDLSVVVDAASASVASGHPVTYTLKVANEGAEAGKNVVLSAVFSSGQVIQSVTSDLGEISTSASGVKVSFPHLAVGAVVDLTVTTMPSSAGNFTCEATLESTSLDMNFSNDHDFKWVSVGYSGITDFFNTIQLNANNLINDSNRNLLWASIPAGSGFLSRSVVSLDPVSGLLSDPIYLQGDPMPEAFALSGNGNFLYVGLKDSPEIVRINLSVNPPTTTRVMLADDDLGDLNYASDIQVLEGDGLSIIVANRYSRRAAVYDGNQMRGSDTGFGYFITRLEKASAAGTFIGYDPYVSGNAVTRMNVDASGITVSQSAESLISGFNVTGRSVGNLILSNEGKLIDSDTLTLKFSLNSTGIPCMDSVYQRSYLIGDTALNSYDNTTGTLAGSFALPTTGKSNWVADCVRWGRDGFAILGNEGNIYITRWSETIPADRDENADGISDRWASTHFNTLGINPAGDSDGDGIADGMEYFFGSNPKVGSRNPLTVGTAADPDDSVIHLKFPRRKGISRSSYDYETSPTMGTWGAPAGVTETVLSNQTVDGVEIENVDATIRTDKASRGFVRMKWK